MSTQTILEKNRHGRTRFEIEAKCDTLTRFAEELKERILMHKDYTEEHEAQKRSWQQHNASISITLQAQSDKLAAASGREADLIRKIVRLETALVSLTLKLTEGSLL